VIVLVLGTRANRRIRPPLGCAVSPQIRTTSHAGKEYISNTTMVPAVSTSLRHSLFDRIVLLLASRLIQTAQPLTLLLADTDSSSPSSCGLGVLTSHSQTPVVSETTVSSDLLQPLQILAKLAFHAVCQNLAVLAVHNISLSVQEP